MLTGLTGSVPIELEPHTALKTRVPSAIGLIRTGDTTQYANMMLESA
jgi:D-ribose pyranase